MSIEHQFSTLISLQHRIAVGADFIDQILKNNEINFLEKYILIIVVNETEFLSCGGYEMDRSTFDKYFKISPVELDAALIGLKNKKLLDYCGRVRQAKGLALPYDGFRF